MEYASNRRLTTIWRANLVVLLVLLVCIVSVDMDGEYPFLPGWASLLLSLAVLGMGMGMSAYLTIADKKHRLFAGMLLVLFLLAALPVFM
jgi:hypothetical protein